MALGIIGWLNGSTLAVILCFTLAGGLLAFLKYNFHPARIFLGDTGSLFLGFSLATISIISSHKTAGTVILAPMLALGVPLFETLVSIARRYMRGVPIFCADSRHTHHRLLQRGFSQRQAVLILYACALACLVAAVLALSGSTDLIVFSGVGVYAAAMLAIGVVAGYIQIEPIREIVKRRSRNAMLTAFAQYAGAKINNASSKDQLALILNLMRMELELAFLDLEYGEERVRVAGANSSAKSIAAGKKERVSFKNANGFEISLTYRIETERPSEAQKEDTAACLAGALSCVQPNTFLGAAAIRMAREMAEREQTLEAAKASSQPKRQFAPVGGASTASVA